MKDNMTNIKSSFLTLSLLMSLSYGSYQFCNWYECDLWSSILRGDLICNACIDASYHLKNLQMTLYGSLFTFLTYKMTSLVNKVISASDSLYSSDSSDSSDFEELRLTKKTH